MKKRLLEKNRCAWRHNQMDTTRSWMLKTSYLEPWTRVSAHSARSGDSVLGRCWWWWWCSWCSWWWWRRCLCLYIISYHKRTHAHTHAHTNHRRKNSDEERQLYIQVNIFSHKSPNNILSMLLLRSFVNLVKLNKCAF